jgi:hypothetical protein
MFRPKRNEMAGWWRKLHNEEFHNLCSSQNFVGVIKSRIGCAKHIVHMGER